MQIRPAGVKGLLLLAATSALIAATARGLPNPEDVSGQIGVEVVRERTEFDRVTRQLVNTLDVTLCNRSDQSALAPLHLAVSVSTNRVSVRNALGTAGQPPYQAAYLDLSGQLVDGMLRPATTATCFVTFVREADVAFTYTLKSFSYMNRQPVVNTGGPYQGQVGSKVSFDSTGTYDPEQQPLTYKWDLGDGTRAEGTNVAHTFGQAGTYRVALTVEDSAGGQSARQLFVPVLPAGSFAVGRTRSLDEAGHPLGGVTVTEWSAGGQRSFLTEQDSGYANLGGSGGGYAWAFSKEGYLPVWRAASLPTGSVTVVPNPWLARRSADTTPLSPLRAAQIGTSNGAVAVDFEAGAFPGTGSATLTMLDGQTLPGFLPRGWSPLNAFWLECTPEPAVGGTARLMPAAPLPPAGAAWVRWSVPDCDWRVVELVSGSTPTSAVVSVAGSGAYALVVPDGGALAPPSAQVVQPLPASGAAFPDSATLTAVGSVEPPVAPASTAAAPVTAIATVTFTATNPIPSGLILRCEMDETYVLADGSVRKTPGYETFVAAYQQPGDASLNTLHSRFRMRPRLLLGATDLTEATLHAEVWPPGAFSGAVVDGNGGVAAGEGIRVRVAPGDLDGLRAVELRSLDALAFARLSGLNASNVLLALELNMAGLQSNRVLAVEFDPLAPNAFFVLAKVLSGAGYYGLQPVERFASGADGRLRSGEPVAGERLAGVTGPGQYVLVRMAEPQALVTGVVRDDAGQAAGGLRVRVAGRPWMALSDPGGRYRLVAPTGAVEVVALDAASGNEGRAAGQITSADVAVVLDIGLQVMRPQVVSTTPADGAAGVGRVTPVTVAFSEPIRAATFGPDAILLLSTNGSPMLGTVALSVDGRIGTFLPAVPLDYSGVYTVRVSGALADLAGYAIEGPLEFSFATESAPVRGAGAQLVIYQPGSTNCPAIGTVPGYVAGDSNLACVVGTQGVADPEVAVILVNQDLGETATVLSKPDGSFVSFIRAREEDLISAVFVNANGSRIEVPAGRQLFDDGRVGLYAGGGVVEAQSADGPVQIIVEPGAVQMRNVFRIEPLTASNLVERLGDAPAVDAQLLSGIAIGFEGEALAGKVDVSFPLDPAVLKLPPDQTPEDGAFALLLARRQDDGVVYEVVDKLQYENGYLRSHSWPFAGIGSYLVSSGFKAMETANEYILRTAFMGPKPFTISGRTYEVNAGVERPLSGARATYAPTEMAVNAQPGRLKPGAVFASSDNTGRFALVAPYGFGSYNVWATHPRFTDRPTKGVYLPADLTTAWADLRFDSPVELNPASHTVISHNPRRPGSGTVATLNVTATGMNGTPTIAVTVGNPSGVQYTDETSAAIGFNRRELTARVCATNRVVALTVMVTDGGAAAQLPYWIPFFDSQEPGATNMTPSDAADRTGPTVVRTSPPRGSLLAIGSPLVLEFNEPIAADIVDRPGLFTARAQSSGNVSPLPRLELRERQTRLEVWYPALEAGQLYVLTVPADIEDLSGNGLNAVPGTAAHAESCAFRTAATVVGDLAGVGYGGGIVQRGAYAYVLDRTDDGGLRVFDVSIPKMPVLRATVGVLHDYPRDLALIPRYGHVPSPGAAPVTNDLLAIVGGKINYMGEEESDGQTLTLFNISNPENPQRVLALRITLGKTVVSKVVWSAPYLAYFDTDPEAPYIGLINLQELIYGLSAPNSMPARAVTGLDLNHDGDYVDPGERIPQPARSTLGFYGKGDVFAFAPTNGVVRRIIDFAYHKGYCGVTLEGADSPSAYLTLASGGLPVDPLRGMFEFSVDAYPRRVSAFFGVGLATNDDYVVRDLALVSLRTAASPDVSAYKLAVLDITRPEAPTELRRIEFPPTVRSLGSVFARDDGLLGLATDTDLILLDPRKLALPNPPIPGSPHPAIVGMVPGAGSGNFTFSPGNAAGIHAVALGGRCTVIQTAPRLRFVAAPARTHVADAAGIAGNAADATDFLADAVTRTTLPPARYRAEGGAAATLDPPDPKVYYHVLIDAPGGAGDQTDIALESMNLSGWPLRNKGAGFAPVRALSAAALGRLLQTTRSVDAPVRELKAYRLGGTDKTSPLYNLYLSEAFALTYERIPRTTLSSLPHIVLWSGGRLRAELHPPAALSGNAAIDAFLSAVNEPKRVIDAGAHVEADTFPAPYAMGPNPPPLGGAASLPWTFGLVNANNAELRHTTTDLSLPSRRMPIAFTRTIGGQDLYDGAFGRGWDANYLQRLVRLDAALFPAGNKLPLVVRANDDESTIAKGGDVLFQTGYGRMIHFRDAGTNAPPEVAGDPLVAALGWANGDVRYYLPERGVFDVLFRFSDLRYARLTPDGTRYWYDRFGTLDKIVRRYTNNVHRLAHNARGELRRITDEAVNDRWVEIGYWRPRADDLNDTTLDRESSDGHMDGLIGRLKDCAGRDVLFEYTGGRRLDVRKGVDLAGANNGYAGRPQTFYLWSTDDNENIKGLNNSKGPVFAVASFNAPAEQPAILAASVAGARMNVAPPTPNRADGIDGGMTSISGPAECAYTFDRWARPGQVRFSGSTDSSTFVQSYSDDGLLTETKAPLGNGVIYHYDAGNANLRSRAYLKFYEEQPDAGRGGDTITETYPPVDSMYNLPDGEWTDRNGKVNVVHSAGELDVASIKYAGAGTRTWEYNDWGQTKIIRTATGVEVQYEYWPDTGGIKTVTRGRHVTRYGNGAILGLPDTVRPPVGDPLTGITYDERLMRLTLSRGGWSESRGYDALGNPAYLRSSVGGGHPDYEEERSYSAIGFLESVTVGKVDTDTRGGAADFTTTYTPMLNAPWRVFKVERVGTPNSYTYTGYDHLGNVRGFKLGAYTEAYKHDANGNLESVFQGGAEALRYDYDGHDRRKTITRLTGGQDAVSDVEYFNDGTPRSLQIGSRDYGDVLDVSVGNVDGLSRPLDLTRHGNQQSSIFGLSYDDTARKTTVQGPLDTLVTTRDPGGSLDTVLDADGLIDLDVDINGNGRVERLTSTEDGTPHTHDLGYNGLDDLKTYTADGQQILTLTPRPDGLPTSVTDARGVATTLDHSALGEPLRRQRGLTRFDRAYRADRLPEGVRDTTGAGLALRYDDTLRVDEITRRDLSRITVNDFDDRNRPTDVTIPGGHVSAQYDLQGRPTSETMTYQGTADTNDFTYDALDRMRSLERANGDGLYIGYDKLGPMTGMTYKVGNFLYSVQVMLRADGARSVLRYPSGVELTYRRENSGRLRAVELSPSDVIYEVTAHHGLGAVKTALLGSGAITQTYEYDGRKRVLACRYANTATGKVLVDLRYQYEADNDDSLQARQRAHDHGRADVFTYDAEGCLTSAEIGARPTVPGAAPRTLPGMPSPLGGLAAGFYGWKYAYSADGLDKREGATDVNPDGFALPPVARVLANFDVHLCPLLVDGYDRSPADPWGNTAHTMLWVREAGAAAPRPVAASLFYNGYGQLIRVERADRATVEYQYMFAGLAYRRTVKDGSGSLVSDRVWVYESGLLLQEQEVVGGTPRPVARYYYEESDAPVACDLWNAGVGRFDRYYYLRAPDGSVVALADAAGDVVERVAYDPFGQAIIEPRDAAAPHVARVEAVAGGLRVQFSETVLPPLTSGSTVGLVTATGDPADAIRLTDALGGTITSDVSYVESVSNAVFGAVLQVQPRQALPTNFVLRVVAGGLQDAWGNTNSAENLALALTNAVGNRLYLAAVTNTAPVRLARSTVGNPFLFHGQYVDDFTGLVYLRARFYDPYTGLFLQQDPILYRDSVNPYAAFRWDPVNRRDPNGRQTGGDPSLAVCEAEPAPEGPASAWSFEMDLDDPLLEVKEAFADAAREGAAPEHVIFYVREQMQMNTADRVLAATVALTGFAPPTEYYRIYEAQWKPFYDATGFQGYVGEPTVRDRGVSPQKPYVTAGDVGVAMLNLGSMGINVLTGEALVRSLGAAIRARSATAAAGALGEAAAAGGTAEAEAAAGITMAEVREIQAGYENAIRATYGAELERLESIAAKMPVNEASGQNLAVQLQNELDLSFGMRTSRHPAVAGSTLEGMERLGSEHARRIAAEMYRARLEALQGRIWQLEAPGYY